MFVINTFNVSIHIDHVICDYNMFLCHLFVLFPILLFIKSCVLFKCPLRRFCVMFYCNLCLIFYVLCLYLILFCSFPFPFIFNNFHVLIFLIYCLFHIDFNHFIEKFTQKMLLNVSQSILFRFEIIIKCQ